MSNELVRSGQKYLASSSSNGLKRDAGKGLVTVGGGGLVLWTIAGALPFITLPLLLILAVVLGGYWWVKP